MATDASKHNNHFILLILNCFFVVGSTRVFVRSVYFQCLEEMATTLTPTPNNTTVFIILLTYNALCRFLCVCVSFE